ncbi:MAG: alpha/beta hydrolase [Burkholderiales bacterium]|nr:MAG: alpha/beta hydrolase [Burkholderiales bacterium]
MNKLIRSLVLAACAVALPPAALAATPGKPAGAVAAALESAPTQFVEAAGIKFAYRVIGSGDGTPLLLLQHFIGTMDYWDPRVVNGLARHRQVIVFDNTGIGASSGKVPDNVDQMSTDALAFVQALGYRQVDVLGYSLGGMVAQQLAARHPTLVRKVVLANTVHPGGGNDLMNVLGKATTQKQYPDPRMVLFFTESERSLAAGRAFLERVNQRKADRDPENPPEVAGAHAKAIIVFSSTPDPENKLLNAIRQPVLVVTGSNDTMLPSKSSYEMYKLLKDAQLVMYPDSNHGAIFQYADRFVAEVDAFLKD